jgi:hypothetical protein
MLQLKHMVLSIRKLQRIDDFINPKMKRLITASDSKRWGQSCCICGRILRSDKIRTHIENVHHSLLAEKEKNKPCKSSKDTSKILSKISGSPIHIKYQFGNMNLESKNMSFAKNKAFSKLNCGHAKWKRKHKECNSALCSTKTFLKNKSYQFIRGNKCCKQNIPNLQRKTMSKDKSNVNMSKKSNVAAVASIMPALKNEDTPSLKNMRYSGRHVGSTGMKEKLQNIKNEISNRGPWNVSTLLEYVKKEERKIKIAAHDAKIKTEVIRLQQRADVQKPSIKFQCSICMTILSSSDDLNTHLNKKHNISLAQHIKARENTLCNTRS